MDANQLLVIDVQGSAGIIQADGSIKALEVGDVITVGDTVVTAEKSTLTIDVQGESLAIPASKRITITPDLVAKGSQDSSENTVFDESIDDAIASLNQANSTPPQQQATGDISDFLQALEGDGDILDNLEATAAGGTGSATSGGGTSFVELARIAEGIDPSGLSFDDSLNAGSDGIFTPRDTTDGVVPNDALATLSVNELGNSNNPQPVISGTTQNLVGETLTVTVTDVNGNTQVVTVIVQPDGTFTTTPLDPLPDGPIVIDVDVIDPNGNPLNDNILANIDTTGPQVQLNALNDSASPNVEISGTVSGIEVGGDVTITVTDSQGRVQTIVTQVDEQGNWSITAQDLSEGLYNVVASAIDEVGNEGVDTDSSLIDLTPPDITLVAIADTNDTTPTFVGRVDDVPEGTQVRIQVVDSNGQSQIFIAIVGADGSYTVDATAGFPEGAFTAIATVVDPVGNSASANANGEIAFSPISITINSIADSNDPTPFLSGQTEGVAAGTTIMLMITASNGQVINLLAVTQADGSWSLQMTEPLPEGDFTIVATVLDPQGNEAQATAVGNVDLTVSINFIIDTNDTTPVVTGSTQDVDAGTVVTVTFIGSDGATETLQVITDANGDWSVEATTPLVEGTFTVTATVTDAVGNTATATEIGEIDLTDPVISIDTLNDTNDTTPTISGSVLDVPAGTTVTLLVTDSSGNAQTLITTTDADGNWQVDVINDLAEGDYTVTASVSDEAGNNSTATATGTVDLTPPIITINTIGDVNDLTPTVDGTTQTLDAGTEVAITVTDSSGAQQTFITSTNADGSWSITLTEPLAEGEFTVVAQTQDAAGNTAQDTEVGVIDLTGPTIEINDFTPSNDVTPLISGVVSGVDVGTQVTVTLVDSNGNQQTLTATVNADNSWQVGANQAIVEGPFTITATVNDLAGNQATDTAQGIIDLTAPIITLDDPGSSADTTPTISGVVEGVDEGTAVTIVVVDANGNSQELSAVTNINGGFSIDAVTELSEGQYTVTATVADAAGNQASATANGLIDSSLLTITIDAIGETNDTTPTISGTTINAAPGNVITVVVTPASGPAQSFVTQVGPDGSWSIEVPTALAEGEVSVDATVTNSLGNTANEVISGIIDITAPVVSIDEIGVTNDSTPIITGSAEGALAGSTVTVTVFDAVNNSQTYTTTLDAQGNWVVQVTTPVSEGNFSVTASVTDNAGNTGLDTEIGTLDSTAPLITIDNLGTVNDPTPIISGTTNEPAGSIVQLTVSNGVDSYVFTAIVSGGGTWAAEVPEELQNGTFDIVASITDAQGNEAVATSSFVLNASGPSLSIDTINDTNDTTPTISGTSDAPNGTVVSIIVEDSNSNLQALSAVVQNGIWVANVTSPLSEGAFSVSASVTVNGITGDATAQGLVDITPPTVSIDALADTTDITPLISGQASGLAIGSVVTLQVTDSAGNTQSLAAVVGANGNWSVEVETGLAEGTYTVEATVADTAGNTASDTTTGVVDLTAPTISIDPISDTNDVTPILSGQTVGVPTGSQVTLVITDSAGSSQTIQAVTLADGSWSVEVTASLAEGGFNVEASVVDNAGNIASDTTAGVVDLTAPTISIDPISDTNDVTPILSGQTVGVPTGSQVTLVITDSAGSSQSIQAVTLADGSWSVEVTAPLAEGGFNVEATVADTAGNTASDTTTGVVDLTAPLVSVNGPFLTNDDTPLVTGTSDLASASVEVTFTDVNGDSHIVVVQTDSNGSWSAEASQSLADGSYNVSASITDAAGNTGTDTDSGVIDTIPPQLAFEPTLLLGQLITLSGTSDLPAGSVVTVTQNLIGAPAVTTTVTTDANGNWSLTGLSVPIVNLASITATASDAAGNVTTITTTDFDDTPPILTVSVDALTNDNTPLISGTTDAGQGAQVTVVVTDQAGNSQTLTATVNANGEWSISPNVILADGTFTVSASVQNSFGNTTTETASGVIDTVAPSLTLDGVGSGNDVTPVLSGTSDEIGATINIEVTDSNGTQQISATVASDGTWSVEVPNGLAEGSYTVTASVSDDAGNTTTQNATGDIDITLPIVTVNNNGLGNDSTPLLSGTSGEAAGTVVNLTVTDINGDTYDLTATVDANGDWQVEAPSLPDGNYTVSASITDDAGNIGTASGTGNIDTVAPAISINSLGTVNTNTPTISGTSTEPQGTQISLIVTDSNNVDVSLTAVVDSNGDWSVTSMVLADDDYTVVATVVDPAGNTASASSDFTVNISAPSMSVDAIADTNDTTPTITGTTSAPNGSTVTVVIDDGTNPPQTLTATLLDGIWSVTPPTALAEGNFTVTATVTVGGVDGEASTIGVVDLTAPAISINNIGSTNDDTPTISGVTDASAGSTVTLEITDSLGGIQTITATVQANGTWSVSPSIALAEGSFTVNASVFDVAGNEGTATETGLIDTTAPTIVIDPLSDTTDVTPLISGQSSGASVGTLVTLTITDGAGQEQVVTTQIQPGGVWSVEVTTPLAEGEYTVNATFEDAAGNQGSDTETGNVDLTAPNITIDAPELTNDNTPTVTGTSDLANTQLDVTFLDANSVSHVVTVTTDASGNWSADAGQALADGSYTVSATVQDNAGNTGTASDSGIVDTIAPDIRIIPSFLLGNLVGLSGTSDLPQGSVITITEQLVGGLVGATYTATTDANGDWEVANITVPLLNLAYVTATATDEAGNTATVSTLNFDNVAPVLTLNVDSLTNDTTPTISGTTDMGEGTVINITVTDSAGGSQSFTATVLNDQTWSVDVPTALAEGGFTVTASVSDEVGNLTTEQASGVLDSVTPSLVINDIGATADVRPTISGSSNEIGGTVVVEVAGQTITTTVASDGTWQFVVPLDISDGSYTVTATITDDANNTQTVTTPITVDTVDPVVTLDALVLGNSSTPVISGTSTEPQGTLVDVSVTDSNGDIQTLTATVQIDGTWQVTPSDLPDGNYSVTASITDSAGNSGSASDTGAIDTFAPILVINGLGTINDTTPTISGTTSEPQGSTVNITVENDGNTYPLTATVQADGSWSVDVSPALTDGAVSITASITDAASNTTTATETATLDSNAPTIAVDALSVTNNTTPTISGTSDAADTTQVTVNVEDALGNIQTVFATVTGGVWSVQLPTPLSEGSFSITASVTEGGLTGTATRSGEIDLTAPLFSVNTPDVTNDTTPTISGTSDAPQGTLVSITVTDALNNEVTASAIVGASGNWSVALASPLAEGAYTIDASITDAAGNTATDSASGSIDITPADVTIDPIAVTSDLTPSVTGSATGATAGSLVIVTFVDSVGVSHSVETTLDANLEWQVEATQNLAEGAYTVTAVVRDSAGNDGSISTTAVIDTIAPTISINASSLILTNDSTPTVNGTSDLANSNIIVTFTAAGGVTHSVAAVTDVNGDWQATATQALADGTYSVAVSITDEAGNTGTDSKTGGEVDTVAPELSIVPSFLLGNLVSLSGTSDLPEGSVISITNHLVGGGVSAPYTATVDANGDWQVLNLSVSLLTLAYVEASATDAAGNTTTISSIDYSNDPSLDAFNVTNYNPGVLGLLLPSASGEAEPGTEVYAIGSNLVGLNLLNIVDLSLLNSAPTVTADSNGDWFISLSVLDLGNEYYFAIVDPVTGDFIVKNTENDLVGTGVLDTEPDGGLIGLGSEPLLADFDESEEQMAQGTEPQPLGESIDLSMVMTDTSTDSTIAEGAAPLELSIDDVLTDSEQTDVLALDTGSESQSLAFNGEPEVTSDAANDIQNDSEELIKKLIEGGNNAIDI